jgi:hypothetical protein
MDRVSLGRVRAGYGRQRRINRSRHVARKISHSAALNITNSVVATSPCALLRRLGVEEAFALRAEPPAGLNCHSAIRLREATNRHAPLSRFLYQFPIGRRVA